LRPGEDATFTSSWRKRWLALVHPEAIVRGAQDDYLHVDDSRLGLEHDLFGRISSHFRIML